MIKTKTKKKRKKYEYFDEAVLWQCPQCKAYNLHPLDWEVFECIRCRYVYYALASARIRKKEIK